MAGLGISPDLMMETGFSSASCKHLIVEQMLMTIFRIYNTEKEAGAGTEELNWLKETVWSIGKSEEKSYLIYWTLALNLFIQVYYDKGLELVKRANGSVSNKTVLEWIANQVLTFDQ